MHCVKLLAQTKKKKNVLSEYGKAVAISIAHFYYIIYLGSIIQKMQPLN